MLFARIVDAVVFEVVDFDPVAHFHPDVAALFEPIPEGTVVGATRNDDGAFTNPFPPVPGEPIPPVDPSEAEKIALIKRYDGYVQKRLDDAARAFGYGDPNKPEISPILHVISYADEPAVVKFQAEGRLFRACRSLTWAKSAVILQAVEVGERLVPSETDLLAELDAEVPLPTKADVDAEIVRLTAA